MCDSGSAVLDVDTADLVTFTYDVVWSPSDVRWSSRWDSYLKMGEGKIHWFSIINSLMVVLFLSGNVVFFDSVRLTPSLHDFLWRCRFASEG